MSVLNLAVGMLITRDKTKYLTLQNFTLRNFYKLVNCREKMNKNNIMLLFTVTNTTTAAGAVTNTNIIL